MKRFSVILSVFFGGAILLSGCQDGVINDYRGPLKEGQVNGGIQEVANLERDANGVMAFPENKVVSAQAGDTPASIAARLNLDALVLAEFNGMQPDTRLRQGKMLVLYPQAGIGGMSSDLVDVTAIAETVLHDSHNNDDGAATASTARRQQNDTTLSHRVKTGETVASIAGLYDVSRSELAAWNELRSDSDLRIGQFLLIPKAPERQVARAPSSGVRSNRSTALSGLFSLIMPVQGEVQREFGENGSEGLDILARVGSPVRAAAAGEVAAVTYDTDGVAIIILRHAQDKLTVYEGVENISVKKGDKVKAKQKIANVRAATPSLVHFQLLQGFDPVNPALYF